MSPDKGWQCHEKVKDLQIDYDPIIFVQFSAQFLNIQEYPTSQKVCIVLHR